MTDNLLSESFTKENDSIIFESKSCAHITFKNVCLIRYRHSPLGRKNVLLAITSHVVS